MSTTVNKPQIPDHEMLRVIGRGAYGEIWLARSLTGALRAVKVVHRSTFESERSFNREFEGMSSFEPVSRSHEGFMDILHVGRTETFFYYIMELADDCENGQHIDASHYTPKTLKSELEKRKRLPADECIEVGLLLTTALEALHTRLLAHRDIKPANIIFVNGKPKLADIGLVAVSGQRSFVGTEGYVPHEGPGTPQADIYSLGKVLYEISMGKDRLDFPEVSTALDELPDKGRLLQLNRVLLKACANEPARRYGTAREMHDDLALLNGVKPRKSHAGRWAAAALLCLALAGWGIFHFAPKYNQGVPTAVKIETDPPGAMVLLGDKMKKSPADFEDVESGKRDLHVGLAGYDPVDMKVDIAPGVPVPPIKLARSKGSLQLATQPGGGAFELRADGKVAAKGTAPAMLNDLPTGVYELVARKDGRELKESIEIKRGETLEKELIFAWGSVAVTSDPAGAQIFAAGEARGKTPQRVELPAGRHQVTVKYQDWPEQTREVTIEHGKDAVANFEFSNGSVKITSAPGGATVLQFGKELGQTPLLIEEVKPGEVHYELQMAGYKPAVLTGTVVAKEQTFLAERLEHKQGPEAGKAWENSLGMKFLPAGDSALFCMWKVRVKDYAAFCDATGRRFEKPDFEQSDMHPVVKVNWHDAEAFCKWLTDKEHADKVLEDGESYRLPTDQEWSFAAGLPDEGGSTPEERDGKIKNEYPWGKAWPPPPGTGNYADISARKLKIPVIDGYNDTYAQTSPVGSFLANKLGLFDMGGNVWEWVQDDYKGGNGKYREWGVLRGGSWANSVRAELQLSYRNVVDRNDRDVIFGFRCVLVFEKAGEQ